MTKAEPGISLHTQTNASTCKREPTRYPPAAKAHSRTTAKNAKNHGDGWQFGSEHNRGTSPKALL